MHWVIQNNLFHEEGFHELVKVLTRLDLPYTLVEVLPSGGGTEPDITVSGPIVVMGSMSLARHARARGWTPGAFFTDQFDFEVWRQHLGAHLLNADAEVHGLDGVPHREGPFFIRPCLDGKAFSGQVMEWKDFVRWREEVLSPTHSGRVRAGTRVAVNGLKSIQREYRMVVVDGRVITGSLYKRGGKALLSSEVEPEVRSFAQRMADLWGPDRAYVVDVFMHEDTLYVGEYNSINIAGFYACDVGLMVAALEGLETA